MGEKGSSLIESKRLSDSLACYFCQSVQCGSIEESGANRGIRTTLLFATRVLPFGPGPATPFQSFVPSVPALTVNWTSSHSCNGDSAPVCPALAGERPESQHGAENEPSIRHGSTISRKSVLCLQKTRIVLSRLNL